MKKNKQWQKIWDKKYSKNQHESLHVQDGFDDLTYEQWQKLSYFFLDKIDIKSTDDVLEVGCGAGAFAQQIKPYRSISGIDYSSDAIQSIKNNIPKGSFHQSEASSLPFNDNIFDKIICFSVFFYFPDYEYAKQALKEMLRVLRPGGVILVGEVSDIDKREVASKLRGESKKAREARAVQSLNAEHLYYSVDFFKQFATENNLGFSFINEAVPALAFYESSAYRFSVLLQDRLEMK